MPQAPRLRGPAAPARRRRQPAPPSGCARPTRSARRAERSLRRRRARLRPRRAAAASHRRCPPAEAHRAPVPASSCRPPTAARRVPQPHLSAPAPRPTPTRRRHPAERGSPSRQHAVREPPARGDGGPDHQRIFDARSQRTGPPNPQSATRRRSWGGFRHGPREYQARKLHHLWSGGGNDPGALDHLRHRRTDALGSAERLLGHSKPVPTGALPTVLKDASRGVPSEAPGSPGAAQAQETLQTAARNASPETPGGSDAAALDQDARPRRPFRCSFGTSLPRSGASTTEATSAATVPKTTHLLRRWRRRRTGS